MTLSFSLVLATGNAGKIDELTRGLAPLGDRGLKLLTAADYPPAPAPPETGSSYRENAALKALAWARRTGLPSLADDSGLEVAALGGAPGVNSARFAGPEAADGDNNRKLLAAMTAVSDRRAAFRCCLALAWPDGTVHYFEAACQGLIAARASGEGGFGYDPVFQVPGCGATLAGLPPAVKDSISHRGRALALVRDFLAASLEGEPG